MGTKYITGFTFGFFVLVIVFVFPPLLTSGCFDEMYNFTSKGAIGDTIGGIINPFIAILAAWLTYKAFIMQYEANEQLKKSSEVNRFENVFFNLLHIQQEITNGLILRVEVHDMDKTLEDGTHPTKVIVLHGREIFRSLYEDGTTAKIHLDHGLVVFGGIKNNISRHGINYMAKNEELSFLDHYFRHIYRILKYVDETEFLNRHDKYNYICMLRAQLSDYELGLIFYNCLSENGINKFKPLTEKYALFNNIRDKVLNNPFDDKAMYETCAFSYVHHCSEENPLKLRKLTILEKKDDLEKLPQGKLLINTINAHSYNTTQKDFLFADALMNGDVLIPDGVSIVKACRWLKAKSRPKERIAGWDLFDFEMKRLKEASPDLSKGEGNRRKVMFMGSSEKVLSLIRKRAAEEYPNIEVVTYSPPYKPEFSKEDNDAIIKAINDANPDLLWIGMTAPKQEKWAYSHWNELNIHCHCGTIGAVFDFYAGTAKRAPEWWQDEGLEWLYRLILEPRRMWRRYVIGNFRFLYIICRERFGK